MPVALVAFQKHPSVRRDESFLQNLIQTLVKPETHHDNILNVKLAKIFTKLVEN